MRKTKILRFIAVVIAIFSLSTNVACGRQGQNEEKDPNKSNITVWVQHTQYEFFKSIEEDFETEFSDVNVIISPQPSSNLSASLDATLGGNTEVDIVATYGGLVASSLVKSKRILEIDDVIKPIEDKLIKAAKTNKMDGNGKYYTAPLQGFASPVVFYNKTLFESMKNSNKLTTAQKEMIKEPSTYTELVSLCNVIKAYDLEPLAAAFSTWHLPHFMQAMHTRTTSVDDYAKYLDKNAEENPFDTASFQDGFKLLKKYSDDGIFVKNVTTYSTDAADTMFYNEAVALRMGVSSDYEALNENATFEIGAFFLPAEDDFKSNPIATGVFADVLAISAKTPYADACKQFVSYVMRGEIQSKLASFSLFPARNDADVSGKFSETLEKIYNETKKGCNDFYQSWSYSGLDIELLYAGQNVILGKKSDGSIGNLEEITLSARKKIADYFNVAKKGI